MIFFKFQKVHLAWSCIRFLPKMPTDVILREAPRILSGTQREERD